MFAGGVGRGQVIRANRILEPRSWSALRVHEGPPPRCRGAVVVFGAAGSVEQIARHTVLGATVTGNVLRGAPFQYGYVVDAVREWTVSGNRSEATHAGVPANDCRGRPASPPAAFLIERSRADVVFQEEFRDGVVEFALWAVPTP